VPGRISRGYGRLIYLSTGLSRRPRDGMITLGTAKAAVGQFVRLIALELPPHGSFKLRLKTGLVGPFEPTREILLHTGGSMRCMLAAEHDLRLASSRGKAS
jgi:NAD(P)-dependent dehydrogenase (short-subunit alcohol dehydrogenase family)